MAWSTAQAKRLFEVEIEAKLNVLAFDEKSARKKVERALGAGRNVGADVEARQQARLQVFQARVRDTVARDA